MCGIAGQVRLMNGAAVPRPNGVAAMTDAISHRGPDDAGIYSDPTTGAAVLGHRRLSIIDLCTGHQPLCDETGTVWTVFNGEIYNFMELRPRLEGQGHVFKTHSDTEVLVHLWQQYGTAMVDHLRGMFVFAIWDQSQQTLFLARDQLGKKPLYYAQRGGTFYFGSELKAILADDSSPREMDPQSLLFYLTFGYVPHPRSILKGVMKLPPGHFLLLREGQARVQRYWQAPRRATYRGTFEEACAELRELLTAATRDRMVADVPLGAFLSGGVDSTIVVGLMSRLSSRPVKTFTIGFDERSYDETEYARRVAAHFNTEHHEFTVRPEAIEVLPILGHHFDEPFADPSAIPTYYVSRETRRHVTVALTGDGGDEAFVGYRRYRLPRLAASLGRVPLARAVLGKGVSRMIPGQINRGGPIGRAKRLLNSLREPVWKGYLGQMSQFAPSTLARLLDASFRDGLDLDEPARWFSGLFPEADRDPAAAAADVDLESYLTCDILTKVDIASMAVALECRSPLLDSRVVEFACRLPAQWRLSGSRHKYILKKAMADLLPPLIRARGKSGFRVPLNEWFRGPLKGMVHDSLLGAETLGRGYFDPRAMRTFVEEHTSGVRNHGSALWLLLMLEQWHLTWMK